VKEDPKNVEGAFDLFSLGKTLRKGGRERRKTRRRKQRKGVSVYLGVEKSMGVIWNGTGLSPSRGRNGVMCASLWEGGGKEQEREGEKHPRVTGTLSDLINLIRRWRQTRKKEPSKTLIM